jgi:hypothetical protein
MLTKADVEILRAPFKPEEVEFLRGYIYVREQAVNNRLSEVDPSWSMQITAWEYRAENHVVVMGSMTLSDATRCGVGEQLNDPSKDGKVKTVDCAKGAATDLLKRLARLFHVGLYLTELGDIKTIEAYTTWYNRVMGITNGNAPKAFPDVAAKEKFVAHWNAMDNLTEAQLKIALNVEGFSQYTGTLAQANKAVEDYKLSKVPFGAKP